MPTYILNEVLSEVYVKVNVTTFNLDYPQIRGYHKNIQYNILFFFTAYLYSGMVMFTFNATYEYPKIIQIKMSQWKCKLKIEEASI